MIKDIIGFATSVGVGQVITNLVEVTTPDNLSKFKRVTTVIGGMAISGVLGKLAADYVEGQIDEINDSINKFTKRGEVKGE